MPLYSWVETSVGWYHIFYFRYTVLQTQNGIQYSTVFDQAGR